MRSLVIDEGTFKFLLTQPISRTKIILSKIIATSSMCLISIFLIVLGIKNGFGSPFYPTKFYIGSFSNFFNNSNNSYGIWNNSFSSFHLGLQPGFNPNI